MDAPADVMTVAEAAGYLRLNQETVRRWLRDHRLPGVRVGSDWRLLRQELDAWLRRDQDGILYTAAGAVPAAASVHAMAIPSAPEHRQVYGRADLLGTGVQLPVGEEFHFEFASDGRMLHAECIGRVDIDGTQVAALFVGGWRERATGP